MRECSRGDVITDRIESASLLIKRGVIGQYHELSAKRLHRYLSGIEYRFNLRRDSDASLQTVRQLCGLPLLRFADLTSE